VPTLPSRSRSKLKRAASAASLAGGGDGVELRWNNVTMKLAPKKKSSKGREGGWHSQGGVGDWLHGPVLAVISWRGVFDRTPYLGCSLSGVSDGLHGPAVIKSIQCILTAI
jgi:hypothetical protein